jgi:hypothetical protein
MNKVTALSALSNAVLVWNSVTFAECISSAAAVRGAAAKGNSDPSLR